MVMISHERRSQSHVSSGRGRQIKVSKPSQMGRSRQIMAPDKKVLLALIVMQLCHTASAMQNLGNYLLMQKDLQSFTAQLRAQNLAELPDVSNHQKEFIGELMNGKFYSDGQTGKAYFYQHHVTYGVGKKKLRFGKKLTVPDVTVGKLLLPATPFRCCTFEFTDANNQPREQPILVTQNAGSDQQWVIVLRARESLVLDPTTKFVTSMLGPILRDQYKLMWHNVQTGKPFVGYLPNMSFDRMLVHEMTEKLIRVGNDIHSKVPFPGLGQSGYSSGSSTNGRTRTPSPTPRDGGIENCMIDDIDVPIKAYHPERKAEGYKDWFCTEDQCGIKNGDYAILTKSCEAIRISFLTMREPSLFRPSKAVNGEWMIRGTKNRECLNACRKCGQRRKIGDEYWQLDEILQEDRHPLKDQDRVMHAKLMRKTFDDQVSGITFETPEQKSDSSDSETEATSTSSVASRLHTPVGVNTQDEQQDLVLTEQTTAKAAPVHVTEPKRTDSDQAFPSCGGRSDSHYNQPWFCISKQCQKSGNWLVDPKTRKGFLDNGNTEPTFISLQALQKTTLNRGLTCSECWGDKNSQQMIIYQK